MSRYGNIAIFALRFLNFLVVLWTGILLLAIASTDLSPVEVPGVGSLYVQAPSPKNTLVPRGGAQQSRTLADDVLHLSEGLPGSCRMATVDVYQLLNDKTYDALNNPRRAKELLASLGSVGPKIVPGSAADAASCAAAGPDSLLRSDSFGSSAATVRALERAYRHSGPTFDALAAFVPLNASASGDAAQTCTSPLQYVVPESTLTVTVCDHDKSGHGAAHMFELGGATVVVDSLPRGETQAVTFRQATAVSSISLQLPSSGATSARCIAALSVDGRQVVADLPIFLRSESCTPGIWPGPEGWNGSASCAPSHTWQVPPLDKTTPPPGPPGVQWAQAAVRHLRSGVPAYASALQTYKSLPSSAEASAPPQPPPPPPPPPSPAPPLSISDAAASVWDMGLQITVASRLMLPSIGAASTPKHTVNASRQMVLDLLATSMLMQRSAWSGDDRRAFRRCFEARDGEGVCRALPYADLVPSGSGHAGGHSALGYENGAYRTQDAGMRSCDAEVPTPGLPPSPLYADADAASATADTAGAAARLYDLCTDVHTWSMYSDDWGVPNPLEPHPTIAAALESADALGLEGWAVPGSWFVKWWGMSVDPPDTYKEWFRSVVESAAIGGEGAACKHAVESFAFVWYVWLAALPTFALVCLLSGMLMGRACVEGVSFVAVVFANVLLMFIPSYRQIQLDKSWVRTQAEGLARAPNDYFFLVLLTLVYLVLYLGTYRPLLRPLLRGDWPRPSCSGEHSGALWTSSEVVHDALDAMLDFDSFAMNFPLVLIVGVCTDAARAVVWSFRKKNREWLQFFLCCGGRAEQLPEIQKDYKRSAYSAALALLTVSLYLFVLSAVGMDALYFTLSELRNQVYLHGSDMCTPGALQLQSQPWEETTREIVKRAAALGAIAWLGGFHVATVAVFQWAAPGKNAGTLFDQLLPGTDLWDSIFPVAVQWCKIAATCVVLPLLIYVAIARSAVEDSALPKDEDTRSSSDTWRSVHEAAKFTLWIPLIAAVLAACVAAVNYLLKNHIALRAQAKNLRQRLGFTASAEPETERLLKRPGPPAPGLLPPLTFPRRGRL